MSTLLTASERSAADIAAAVGYAAAHHFSRAFAAAYGQPPAAWRRAQARALRA